MNDATKSDVTGARIRTAIVLRVREDVCEVISAGRLCSVPYATTFPSPRVERVAPGHLVAIGTAPDGSEVVMWRWYDAVVLGEEDGLLRMWEPSHGEVLAQRRTTLHPPQQAGTRAYLSAGLPGAQWWVAGQTTADAEHAAVELDEVERLYTEHDLWHGVI